MGDENDIRADIAAVMGGSVETEATEAPDTSGTAGAAGHDVGTDGGAGGSEPAAVAETQPGESAAEAAARARDDKGRFAAAKKAAAAKLAAPAVAPAVKPAPGAKPVPPVVQDEATGKVVEARPAVEPTRAPQSWKPGAREEWAKLPPVIQAEVLRREKEASIAMQESAPARKEAEAWRQVVSPFEATIRAEGGEPMAAVQSLLQTAHALRGPRKEMVVAQLIKSFGVDVGRLDALLAGDAPQQQGQQGGAAQEFRDPRLDQLVGAMQQRQQAQAQAADARAAADIEAFKATAEYLEDVRGDMAMLMAQAAHAGKQLTLQQAYDRACWASEDIRPILQRRAQATAAKASTASTQQARNAASSVKSSPAGSAPAQSGSLEEDVKAMYAQLSGR